MSPPKALLEHARNDPEYWHGQHGLLLNTRKFIKAHESTPITSYPDQCFSRTSAIVDKTRLAVLGCLAFRSPVDDLSDWREQGASCSRESLEYLYGDWREGYSDEIDGIPPLTMADARRRLRWVDTFRLGLMWACALDLDADQKRLLAWPDLDVPRENDTLCDRFAYDCDFFILLAKWIRGEAVGPKDRLYNGLQKHIKRRPKLLLSVLDSVMNKGETDVMKALSEYLQFYRKTEFDVLYPDELISIDGTILWHIARQRGLRLEGLGEQYLELIVRPPMR